MTKLVFTHIRPGRLKSGGWTLYEYRYFDEFIPSPRYNGRKYTRRVWPPVKQDNGRGFIFSSQAAAWRGYQSGRYWGKA